MHGLENLKNKKESQSSFFYGLLFVCFTSHTSHGVDICGLAGNIMKPQKQTTKKRLHAVLQHPLPSSVGDVAYMGRRWNTIKIIFFLAREDSTMPIFVFISSLYFYNIIIQKFIFLFRKLLYNSVEGYQLFRGRNAHRSV